MTGAYGSEVSLCWKDEACSQCGAWPKQPCPTSCPVRVCRVEPEHVGGLLPDEYWNGEDGPMADHDETLAHERDEAAERERDLTEALAAVLREAGWDMAYTWVPSDVAPFVKRKLYEAATNKDAAELLSAAEWLDTKGLGTLRVANVSRWDFGPRAYNRTSLAHAILAAARSLGWGGR